MISFLSVSRSSLQLISLKLVTIWLPALMVAMAYVGFSPSLTDPLEPWMETYRKPNYVKKWMGVANNKVWWVSQLLGCNRFDVVHTISRCLPLMLIIVAKKTSYVLRFESTLHLHLWKTFKLLRFQWHSWNRQACSSNLHVSPNPKAK